MRRRYNDMGWYGLSMQYRLVGLVRVDKVDREVRLDGVIREPLSTGLPLCLPSFGLFRFVR